MNITSCWQAWMEDRVMNGISLGCSPVPTRKWNYFGTQHASFSNSSAPVLLPYSVVCIKLNPPQNGIRQHLNASGYDQCLYPSYSSVSNDIQK